MRWIAVAAASLVFFAGCNCGGPAVGNGGEEDGGGGASGDGGTGGGQGGGGGGGGGSGGCISGLSAIAISPGGSTQTIGPAPGAIAFTATGTVSGASQDLTGQLSWAATRDDDTAPGSFPAPGSYQPEPNAGGVVTLRATDGCVTGTTTLTLQLQATFNDPGPTVTGRFGGTVVTGDLNKSPVIVYPSDQTRFPRNIYKQLLQWQKKGNDSFRLTFAGANSTITIYSDGVDPQCQAQATAGCAETDVAMWQAIAGANAGGTVTLTVDGVTQGDANVYRSSPITIGFSRRDVKGAIFYWSTTAAGVRRASVSDRDPEGYVVAKPVPTVLPNGNGQVKCVACHTVSRSGKKMIGFTQAGATGEFVYDVTLDPPPVPIITTQISTAKGFGTFRPDDERVVATVGSLLAEFTVDGGVKVTNLPVAAGTNPDWSPLGFELAYSTKGGDSPGSADLAVIGYDAGAWGPVRTLVPAAGLTNLFPSYSPDGLWVAYARGKGGHGDKTLQLWLARADGTQPPVELVTANRIVNSQVTLGQHENNMPTWAPPGDLNWVAFNSIRPYGVVFPTGGTQQIWVSAIDPARVGQVQADGGLVDPSWPAFRFSFQGLNENNHRAFWTLDVRDEPDAGPSCKGLGSVCASGSSCCEGLACLASEIGNSCQIPSDAGSCIAEGQACSQTGGAACCSPLVCDNPGDGGTATECRQVTIN